jgi:hypothetical protein
MEIGWGWTKAECARCTVVILVVKELGFLNLRSVEALHMAHYVPLDEDQHTLP